MRTKIPVFSLLVSVPFLLGMASRPSDRPEPGVDKPHGRTMTLTSSQQPAGLIHLSLANEVDAAINRGLDWLAANQKQDGSWSNPKFPALTGLAMQCFIHGAHSARDTAVKKAIEYILSCAQKDGGIYRDVEGHKGGGLSNYNTAICMTALHETGDDSLVDTVLKAREFIAGSQHFGDDMYKGGFGYDKKTDRPYADLLNTYYAAAAMAETADVEDRRPKSEKQVRVDWAQTVKFIERMQNKPDTGDDAGGFFYKPTESKAGTRTGSDGEVVLRSYGSITYAGLLALIYADVSREDMRVQSAFDWATKHWSLDENPGMGNQGLYFFYNVLTKSLSVYGADSFPMQDGKKINWREAVAAKLVSLQKIESATGRGYWQNDEGRFWENDPVLSTSYAILALEMLRAR